MSPNWVRRLSLLNVIVNVLIVITGGAVRLTGSGLGCPSWPNCAPGMFHATAEMGMHGAIEWGNRLFGGIVGVVAIATFIAALMRKPRRRSLLWLTGVVATGVAAQAIIGAFLVGSDLAPWLVSIHFLVSVGILAAAFAAWQRSREPDGPACHLVPTPVRSLWWLITAVTVVTLLIGTIVTGAGPHAGDPDSPRLSIDAELAAQLHADAVFALIGLSVALLFTLSAVSAPARAIRAAWILLAVEFAQGGIGMVQYFTGLPVILVGAHLLGAAVLWLAVLAVGFNLRTRQPLSLDAAAPHVGPPIGQGLEDEDDEADDFAEESAKKKSTPDTNGEAVAATAD